MEEEEKLFKEIVETYEEVEKVSDELREVVEGAAARLSAGEKRRLDFSLRKDIVDEIEEIFCYKIMAGERVKMRSLTSVVKDAFLRGVIQMLDEKEKLKELEEEEAEVVA